MGIKEKAFLKGFEMLETPYCTLNDSETHPQNRFPIDISDFHHFPEKGINFRDLVLRAQKRYK